MSAREIFMTDVRCSNLCQIIDYLARGIFSFRRFLNSGTALQFTLSTHTQSFPVN